MATSEAETFRKKPVQKPVKILYKICKTHSKKLAIKTILSTDPGLSSTDVADHVI